jgi:hypothetical protein
MLSGARAAGGHGACSSFSVENQLHLLYQEILITNAAGAVTDGHGG